jgi:DNA-binding IclR family transcriptional regulator
MTRPDAVPGSLAASDLGAEGEVAGDRSFVTALARGLDVLRCFRPGEPVLSNNDIARRTGLPKPTVTRLAHTLCRLGYLTHSDETGLYRLGAGVLELGYGVLAGIEIADRAAEAMRAVQDDGPNPNVSVALGERHRFKMVYVAVQRSRESVSLSMSVGSRLPLFHSAMGRAALCAMSEAERAALLDAAAAEGREDMDVVRRGLESALREHADRGFCSSMGQWRPEIAGVAVPVRSLSGDRLYAMNAGAPSFLVTSEELRAEYGPRLVAAARALSDVPARG